MADADKRKGWNGRIAQRMISAIVAVCFLGFPALLLTLPPKDFSPGSSFTETHALTVTMFMIVALSFVFFYYLYPSSDDPDDPSLFDEVFFVGSYIAGAILYFAFFYRQFGMVDTSDNKTVVHDVGSSLYFSVVTWTTLGYGDLKPTLSSRPIAAAEALFGYITMVLAIAYLGNFLPARRSKTKKA